MRTLLFFCASLLTIHGAMAQLFGPDVIIKPDTVDQRKVELATAFNGWLFTATSTIDASTDKGGISIRKSTDGGYTWTTLDEYSVAGVRYEAHDIIVAGTDEASLTLYLVGVNHNIGANSYVLFVDRYNATTGSFIGSNYNLPKGTHRINDVEIASDYKMPAVGASPYSVAFVYSCYGPVYDSVVGVVSVDGGQTFSVRNPIFTTGGFTRSVTLDYGRGLSASNGRYFAAWEQLSAFSNRTGHIYTSRNTSTINSGWITPENLDSLSSTMINLCRNPRIAVQQNNVDNDSGSVTALITVDRDYNADGSDYDVLGFYNKRAHFTNFWYRFDINNSGENDMSADIFYEDSSQFFHVVYFDSTAHELEYVSNAMQFTAPSSWFTMQSGMNDVTTSTQIPMPRIAFRPGMNELALAWADEGAGGDGVVKFDIESFIFAGLTNHQEFSALLYPNPVKEQLYIELDEQLAALQTQLMITDMNGRVLYQGSVSGQEKIALPVQDYTPGTYLVRMTNDQGFASQLFVKE